MFSVPPLRGPDDPGVLALVASGLVLLGQLLQGDRYASGLGTLGLVLVDHDRDSFRISSRPLTTVGRSSISGNGLLAVSSMACSRAVPYVSFLSWSRWNANNRASDFSVSSTPARRT